MVAWAAQLLVLMAWGSSVSACYWTLRKSGTARLALILVSVFYSCEAVRAYDEKCCVWSAYTTTRGPH